MAAKKILIIDDDPTILKIFQALLVTNGYDVVTCANGEEGLEAIKKGMPHLLVLDINMPRMNGYSFFIEMKKIPGADNIPVIVVTAKEGMAEIFKFEGAKEYLTKPVNNEQFLALIGKHCG